MPENKFLRSLPTDIASVLTAELRPFSWPSGRVILNANLPGNDMVFPVNCVVSIVCTNSGGGCAETAVVGFDGYLAPSVYARTSQSATHCVVHVAGSALALREEVFREHLADRRFRDLVFDYAESRFSVLAQGVVCQAFHTVEQRVARWLLMVQDRTSIRELPVTHELLATMLAVQRPTVTVVARRLTAAGLISYRHGRLAIRDSDGLRARSCDCHTGVGTPPV